MNRLQKKCLMSVVGIHLLLLVILFVGPAFFAPRDQTDDLQVLDVIPANLIDAPFNSGVKNAQPPPPAVQPAPPTPKPAVTPPTLEQRFEKKFKPEPVKPTPDFKPVDKPEKNQPHKIQVNTQLTTRDATKNSTDESQRAQAIQNAIRNLKRNFSPSTTVDMPGNSSAAYANYASVVKSVYEQAWTPPDDAANDDANVKVRITIASDGTVVSARIITPSGDSGVDASIQRTLDRVTFIAPFPEGSKDKERTYIINFNLKAKRMLG
ncbi:MAG: TonB family protein [Limisphaerales bacterium]